VKRVRSDIATHGTSDHSTLVLAHGGGSIDHTNGIETTAVVNPPIGAPSDAVEMLADLGRPADDGTVNSTLPSAASSSIELGMPKRSVTADGAKHDHDQEHLHGLPQTHEPLKEKNRRRRKEREDNKVSLNDFEMMRVLGKGCAGKVSDKNLIWQRVTPLIHAVVSLGFTRAAFDNEQTSRYEVYPQAPRARTSRAPAYTYRAGTAPIFFPHLVVLTIFQTHART
jgi:hypothetical protein